MEKKRRQKRYIKHNNHKKIIRMLVAIFIVAIAFLCLIKVQFSDSTSESTDTESLRSEIVERVYNVTFSDEPVLNYGKAFDDIQELQIAIARAIGVGPATDDSLAYMLADGRLVEVSSTDAFYLHEVSYPYLIPEAKHTLEYIAEKFKNAVGDKDIQLRVTSLMRTSEHVKRLRRGNVNAVEESCHLYGTTFDISYRDLEPAQKQILARILRDLRDSGYCYVKYERKQPCFHITIRK